MTDHNELDPRPHRLGLDSADLDGHTVEELSDYLDAGRTPPDPSIDGSPGCRLALQAMERLRALSGALIDADAAAAGPVDDGWVSRVLGSIALDARAGRRIPIAHPVAHADLAITEGAVRGIIRAAEADVDGVIIGRCRLNGDLTGAGAPVTVSVDASVLWGERIPAVADRLRSAIVRRLAAHTDINVVGVDVAIHDVHLLPATEEET